jgi:glycosyltransferase involved in cell wall biosynthesis
MAIRMSIVIPTFMAANVIDACLGSVAAQGFDNFDVHVLDACSTDDTVTHVSSHMPKLAARLHCISAADAGPYDAMNRCIHLAQGDWIYFMGADDVLSDADVLGDVANALHETTADLVYGDVIMKSSGNRYCGESSLDRLLFEENICHQAIFYRRAIFEKVGGYDLRYPLWADWDLNIRCFRHPHIRTQWIDRVIATYNDMTGLSAEQDQTFRRELPVTLVEDSRLKLEQMRQQWSHEIEQLENERSHRWGRRLFGWLDR